MTEVISVKFKNRGKVYFFDPHGIAVRTGEKVVVETSRGLELAECVQGNHAVPDETVVQPLRSLARIATKDDLRIEEINRRREKEAFTICKQKIAEHGLDMKLVDVECSFEGNKTMFFFTSDGRVDFRELVRDLAGVFRARIELRQIGVRHETQMVGAVGNCGMVCCCRRYLRKFAPVTIRMAKEQNLFLNPAKISGICGRLLCCLSYEQDNYDHFHRMCPRLGKKYQTDKGPMKVLRANMFRNSLSVLTENNEEVELSLDDWQALSPHRPEAPQGVQPKQPPKGPMNDNSLLVVSATPDTLDSLDFMDEFRQDERDTQPEESAPAESGERAPGGEAQAEPGKNRRKRRRNKSQRPDHD